MPAPSPTPLCRAAVLSLSLPALFPLLAVAHSPLLSDRERIADSRHVVVATVAGASARWNPQHSLIVTDYTLRLEEQLKGEAPAEVVLTMPGGTAGATTDRTCFTVALETGGRYLLFLDDLGAPSMVPVTGGGQGVYREVREADGRAVAVGPGVSKLARGGRPASFEELVAAVREEVREVAALPAEEKAALPPSDFPLLSKAYEPLADGTAGAKYVAEVLTNTPIVFNPLPSSSPWSPLDQEQMAYWNLYSPNLFRVMDPPRPTWAYGNGIFDIAGFPDSAQMAQQFNWPWPDRVLGVTFWRLHEGQFTEADIALNPAIPWTLDRALGNKPSSPMWPFRQTMVHELGHGWGLIHPWEVQNVKWDSVLNYSPKAYRLATLWADDTQAVRRTHGGVNIRDGAVAVYTTRDNPNDRMPFYVPAIAGPFPVRPGQPVVVSNPVRVENVGTVTLVNPKVEVYLTPRYASLQGAILLKTVTVNATLPAYAVKTFSLGSLAVPASVRRGSYHLALRLVDSTDAYQGNNVGWSPQK